MAGEPAPKQDRRLANLRPPWKPGESGNPDGRAKGSKNDLTEAFLKALNDDFNKAAESGKKQGAEVIEKVRADDPATYLKIVAALVPKDMNVRVDPLDEIDDDELEALYALLAAARAASKSHAEAGTETRPARRGKQDKQLLS